MTPPTRPPKIVPNDSLLGCVPQPASCTVQSTSTAHPNVHSHRRLVLIIVLSYPEAPKPTFPWRSRCPAPASLHTQEVLLTSVNIHVCRGMAMPGFFALIEGQIDPAPEQG
jgi:hypothetical protein